MFKVGDKVICKNYKGGYNLSKGDRCEVLDIWEGIENNYLKIKVFGKKGIFKIPENHFELLKENKKVEVWTRKELDERVLKGEATTIKLNISPQKVIFNDKATIMFYYSNLDYIPIERKIVAKCQEGDKYSKEDGLRICVLKAMKRELERELKQY